MGRESSDDADEDDDDSRDFCDAGDTRPYFVYLMACPSELAVSSKRMFTHIGKSRDPVGKVQKHNQGFVNSHKRSTRANAPHWKIEEWVGPFRTREDARDFQKLWFCKTKGVKTRAQRGAQLATEHNVVCYTTRSILSSGASKLRP